jgi:integrase/recombinase XerD
MENAYSVAISNRSNELWERLKNTTILDAASAHLADLTPHTKRAYRAAYNGIFKLLHEKGLLNPTASLQVLALSNLENLLDCIRANISGSPATKQARSAVFVAFTKYLERTTGGMIRTVKPMSGTHDATFKKIRSKAHTSAMSHEEWNKFIVALKRVSFRDYLIARAAFQGAKRISEVLDAKIEQIDWLNNRITYHQAKSATIINNIVISYSEEFMKELKHYLYERSDGFIFITRNNKKVNQPHVYRSFAAASRDASLKIRVHPHMLRTTAVTLFMKMGYHSDDVMKVSGHTTPTAVLYYDKTPDEENMTTKVKLC